MGAKKDRREEADRDPRDRVLADFEHHRLVARRMKNKSAMKAPRMKCRSRISARSAISGINSYGDLPGFVSNTSRLRVSAAAKRV